MFKKLLLASAVLAVTTGVAFAGHHASYKGDYKGEQAAAPVAPCPTYTFAAGPYVGVSVGPRSNMTGSPTAFRGFTGTLSAGYGALVNPVFYLAGEIFGSGTAKIKSYKTATNANGTGLIGSKSSWDYGISIIPGYMITDHVLGYLRAGVVRTRFNDTGISSTETGAQVGVGMQTNVYQNWDVRGEYVYSQYGRVSSIGKVQSDQVNVGLVYKFL